MSDQLNDFHTYGAAFDTREIFLHNHYTNDDVNPGVEYRQAVNFVKNLRALDNNDSEKDITIHMHSVGGEWSDGMAIYDAMKMCKSKIKIIVYAQAESMSSIILQAADVRLMTPNSYFMSHFGTSGVGGGYLDVQNWIKYEKYICDVMLDIYAARCVKGKYFKEKYGPRPDTEKVKTYLYRKMKSGDWYITAEEAVYYGFADRIIKSW